MSLIRQIRLLLLLTLVLAFLGSIGLTIASARTTLSTQLQLKNNDNAILLAQVLGQQGGDRELMELVVSAQFDTGFYRSIRFVTVDGQAAISRVADQQPLVAPAWFVRWLPIRAAPGVAQVSDGWRALGAVEVSSQTAYAYDDLWRASIASITALGLLGLLMALLSRLLVDRINKPLARTVEQADALVEGRFITVPEPPVFELQRLTKAMNQMVARLKLMFDAQNRQLETLREQAHTDAVSGVANRRHFIGQVIAARQSDYADPIAGLILMRILDLGEANRQLGRKAADQMITAVAKALAESAASVNGCVVGRLNGSDFALYVPVQGHALDIAVTASERVRGVLGRLDASLSVCVGATEMTATHDLSDALAAVDRALARAESRGAFTVELADAGAKVALASSAQGESSWRENLLAALAGGRGRLVHFPLVDAQRQVLHLECLLRLQLVADGEFEAASHWLPLAIRSRLTAGIDAVAVGLALDEIAADGQARCVNLAPASLLDSGFAARLRGLLVERKAQAGQLSLEVPEQLAVDHFDLVQDLAFQLKPLGIRFGLEHAGQQLGRIDRLLEAGLDYVKLDAAVIHGIDSDPGRAGFLRSLVTLMHGISVQVYAESVSTEAESAAAWQAGVDGQTGPWISSMRPDLVR